MARPRKCRRICQMPRTTRFAPEDGGAGEICMSLDEFESIRLIDLDSGFLRDDPPQNERDLEGDPVYLSPEAFLRMAGQDAPLGPKLDTFAFGALIHRVWTGELPAFDHQKYTYLYEAALSGGDITLSPALPAGLRDAVQRMLDREPDRRPEDAELTALLATDAQEEEGRDARPLNGLSRFMKPAP